MFPHPIPGRPSWDQSTAVVPQHGSSPVLLRCPREANPSINHGTCPSKPKLNDRLV